MRRSIIATNSTLNQKLFAIRPITVATSSMCRSSSDINATRPENFFNKDMLHKLERLSGIRFMNHDEVKALEEDIRLAEKIFDVDTTGVEPLYNIVEEVINCPLREDIPRDYQKNVTLRGAARTMEDFFVTPKANVPIKPNKLFE